MFTCDVTWITRVVCINAGYIHICSCHNTTYFQKALYRSGQILKVTRQLTVGKYAQMAVSRIGNESVPIQLAQRWFPGLAISSAKI